MVDGHSPEQRRVIRQAETKPLVEKLKAWLEDRLRAVSEKSTIAEAIRYGFNHWDGLVRFLDANLHASGKNMPSPLGDRTKLRLVTTTRALVDQARNTSAVAAAHDLSRHLSRGAIKPLTLVKLLAPISGAMVLSEHIEADGAVGPCRAAAFGRCPDQPASRSSD